MTKKMLIFAIIACSSMISASQHGSESVASQRSPNNNPLMSVQDEFEPVDETLAKEINELNKHVNLLYDEVRILRGQREDNSENIKSLDASVKHIKDNLSNEVITAFDNNIRLLHSLLTLEPFANMPEFIERVHFLKNNSVTRNEFIFTLNLLNKRVEILEKKEDTPNSVKTNCPALNRNQFTLLNLLPKILPPVITSLATYAAFNTESGNNIRNRFCTLVCGFLPRKQK